MSENRAVGAREERLASNEALFREINERVAEVAERFVEVESTADPVEFTALCRTPPAIQAPPGTAGSHTDEVLTELGFDVEDVAKLRASGAIA